MRSSVTQTFEWLAVACVAAVLTVAGLAISPVAVSVERYASPTEAYRLGLAAWDSGPTEEAVSALEFAAGKGVLGAQLKLAEIYAGGEGVARSDARAFRLYQQIADQYADVSPRHPVARHVAKAFVALARYYRSGIAELALKPDGTRALALYRHAASYFGDVTAQYELARMYLKGEGVHRNVRLAANWLANASKKHHAPSQALLGDLLWRGESDLRRQPLKGLALLTVARQNAAGTPDAPWVEGLYVQAAGEARPAERERASSLAERWRRTLLARDQDQPAPLPASPAAAPTPDPSDAAGAVRAPQQPDVPAAEQAAIEPQHLREVDVSEQRPPR